jgi:hypothetical protein
MRILFIILVIIPGYLFSQEKTGEAFIFKNDTLKSKINQCYSAGGYSFNQLLSLKVDTNFLVIDSLKCKLNNDNEYDYIFILSNNIQERFMEITDCNVLYNKRLMLIFMSKNGKYNSPIINENVVLNRTDFQSEPFKKIECDGKGFKLSFYLGTRIRYDYDFYFSFDGVKDIFLNKSISRSYDIHASGKNTMQERKHARTQATNIKGINVNKFIYQ